MSESIRRIIRSRTLRVAVIFALAAAAVAVSGRAIHAITNQPFETKAATEGHEQQFLADHSDLFGRVRPDLWRTGVSQFRALPTSAAWHRGQVSAKSLANPASAPGSAVVGSQWKQIGPQPLRIDNEQNFQGAGPDSGEVVDIAIDPRGTSDRTMYIAGNGGIWKTSDGGSHWLPKTDNTATTSMASVALDPANPSTVYAGSGNIAAGSCVFFKGVGLYKSTDGGETWSILGGALFNNVAIYKVRVLPGNVLLLGTSNGLYRSIDGGLNFGANAPNFNDGNPVLPGFVTDLDLDTTAANTVFASVGTYSRCGVTTAAPTGVFRSTDGGQTFTNLFTSTNGAPTNTKMYVGFAQSTSPNNQTLYATTADGASTYGGLFRSTDGGANWTNMPGANTPATGCQCRYDHEIGVDPQNANRVYLAFQDLYLSTDGGGSFNQIGGNAIHDDHHAMVFSPHDTSDPTTVYLGTDGGMHSTADAGSNFDNSFNETIGTNLFFQIDIGREGAADAYKYSYGGTQDTGNIAHKPSHSGTDWHLHDDGDGGAMVVDPNNPQVAFMGGNRCYKKTTDGGDTWNGLPGVPSGVCLGQGAVDPNDGNNVFVASGSQLYRSTTGGGTLSSIFTAGGSAGITDVDTAKIDSNVLWLGLSDGKAAYTTNALAASPTFTTVTVTGAPAGQGVAGIAVDPTDTGTAVVVYAGFNGVVGGVSPHVFRTTDSGSTWSNISGVSGGSANLPDLPLHSVVIDPGTNPHSIIVSSDAGVARSIDLGGSWQQLGVGLPNVDSTSLQINTAHDPPVLRLGTMGRSVWELASPTGPQLAVNADLGFGNVGLGQRVSRLVQLFNVGTADLHISGFDRLSGSPAFSLLPTPTTPVTIAPGEELDFTMQFLPTTRGNLSAIFHIQSDDPSQPDYQLAASGTGVTGKVAVSGSLDFGTVARGTTATRSLTVQNTGLAPLTISGVSMLGGSDPAFTVLSNPGTPQTIEPSDSVVFTVRFAPPASSNATPRSGTVRVASDDPDAPTVDVAATGIPGVPRSTLDSSAFDFGGVPVDNRTTPHQLDRVLRISNQSSCILCDLTITSLPITGSGSFTLVGAPSTPFTIGAGNHIDLTVRFNPPVGGPATATLTVNSDDPANPALPVSLAGEGLLPAIAAAPPAMVFGPTVYDPNCGIVCGQTRNEVFTNTGQAELIADVVGFSGSPAFSGPAASSPPDRYAQGTKLVEPVTFRPTAPARKVTGTLTLRDNLPFDSTTVERQVPLCGEAVGRGIRVLVEDNAGNPVSPVDLQLRSVGTSPNVILNPKDLSLQTIDPPTSCQTIRFHYENQQLPATEQDHPSTSYYTLVVTAGSNRKATITFVLAPNQFREIVMVIDTVPPTIFAPTVVKVTTASLKGTHVRFRVRAVDRKDGRVGVTCRPRSGAFFRLGRTRVTCRAHDKAGNRATRRFTVVVRHRR